MAGRGARGSWRSFGLALVLLAPAVIPAAANSATLPDAPTVKAFNGWYAIGLEWTDAGGDAGAESYTVYRSTGVDLPQAIATVPAVPGGVNDYYDLGVPPNVPETYSVAGTNAAGEGLRSLPVNGAAWDAGGSIFATNHWHPNSMVRDIASTGGAALIRITNDNGDHENPALSPTSPTVAYSANTGHESDVDLWVQTLGSAPRDLVADPAYNDDEPAFSPDGKTLAFTRYRRSDGTSSVWTVPTAGGVPTKIPGTDGDRQPTWAPGGRVLEVTNLPLGSRESTFVIVTPDGRFRRALAFWAGARGGTFSVDGKWISAVGGTGINLYYGRTDAPALRPYFVRLFNDICGQQWGRSHFGILYAAGNVYCNQLVLHVFFDDPTVQGAEDPLDTGDKTQFISHPVDIGGAPPPYTPGSAPAKPVITIGGFDTSSISLDWKASPTAIGYLIRRSAPGGAPPTTPEQGTPVYDGGNLTATLSGLKAGAVYGISVFAMGMQGDVSPPARLTVTAPVTSDDKAMTATGKWSEVTKQQGRYQQTLRTSSTKGASLSLRQTATGFALLADKCASCGSFMVYVDGKKVATVSTYAKQTAVGQVVWSAVFAKAGKHTIKLVVAATKGHPSVRVDGVVRR